LVLSCLCLMACWCLLGSGSQVMDGRSSNWMYAPNFELSRPNLSQMSFYQVLAYAHSGFRYIILLLLVAVVFKSLEGWLNKRPFEKIDDKLSLYFFISAHIMLVAGLVLYFVSPKVQFDSNTMSNPTVRYWTVEHITANVLAIALFTIARIRSKKMQLSVNKHKMLFLFTAAGLVVLVLSLSAGKMAPGLLGSSVMR
jgi:hypothetical protein